MILDQDKDLNTNEDEKKREDELFQEKLETEFPLSGGETEEDWEKATGDLFEGNEDNTDLKP